jgi:ADP-dependent phosphofructokinase/glucokinase
MSRKKSNEHTLFFFVFLVDNKNDRFYTEHAMSKEIVLGLGDNIDYEIRWDSPRIEKLIKRHGLKAGDLDPKGDIHDERSLLATILGFLTNGTGGERFVPDISIIEDFAAHFEKKITLGGTAVRAAIAMRKLGYTSAVHLVTMNEHVTRLVPADCERLCSATESASYPHLIVQYCAGTHIRVGDIEIDTTVANRIIYTNDRDNELMALHPDMASLLAGAKVFLICGFNAMRDGALVEDRMRFLQTVLKPLPAVTKVFFEDACYHQAELRFKVRDFLLDYIDIYSLNEDEFEAYLGHPVAWTEPRAVFEGLGELHRLIPAKTLVVHTRHWALAFGPDAANYRKSLLGGITMATSRFRFGDDFTEADYVGTGKLPLETAGVTFAESIEALACGTVCCVPSFEVSEKDVTTIGLGDTFVGGFLPTLV